MARNARLTYESQLAIAARALEIAREEAWLAGWEGPEDECFLLHVEVVRLLSASASRKLAQRR